VPKPKWKSKNKLKNKKSRKDRFEGRNGRYFTTR